MERFTFSGKAAAYENAASRVAMLVRFQEGGGGMIYDPQTNTFTLYASRSRRLSYQHCSRDGYLNYDSPNGRTDGVDGIQPVKLDVPLSTGSITHEGLGQLLLGKSVDDSVAHALSLYKAEVARRGLLLDVGEDQQYVIMEQSALVEGMLRAYQKRQLPTLLEQFEVLEVEREDNTLLTQFSIPDTRKCSDNDPERDCKCGGQRGKPSCMFPGRDITVRVIWQSRPDALLLERSSGDLYIQSYKTAARWDARTDKGNQVDMQGLSEVWAVEERLAAWWSLLHNAKGDAHMLKGYDGQPVSERIIELLREAPEPPHVQGIRMEFLIKGLRKRPSWDDDEAPQEERGPKEQYSPLIRGYHRAEHTITGGINTLDYWGWKRSYKDEDGKTRRLDWRTWKAFHAWENPGGVKAWIELLDQGVVQAEAGDCLAAQFVLPQPYFRFPDQLRNWIEQTVAEEERTARALITLHTAGAESYQSLRNAHFPQFTGHNCFWPTSCSYVDACHNVQVSSDPLSSGLYQAREPHHPVLVQIGD